MIAVPDTPDVTFGEASGVKEMEYAKVVVGGKNVVLASEVLLEITVSVMEDRITSGVLGSNFSTGPDKMVYNDGV